MILEIAAEEAGAGARTGLQLQGGIAQHDQGVLVLQAAAGQVGQEPGGRRATPVGDAMELQGVGGV
jgi:hypothetical protein